MADIAGGLTLLLGGARSGKSALAVRWGRASAGPVTFVATAEASDDEMAARIARHRAERPTAWHTIETVDDPAGAVAQVGHGGLVIVDCLTLWVANVSAQREDAAIVGHAAALAAAAEQRSGTTVVISNEVGGGIVPADPATRRYRDLLGTVNAMVASRATVALLVVAGRVLPLHLAPASPTALVGHHGS